ncbi:CCA tRNA nucleotidyltransferase [Treponema peruense]|uniref:HD domain-containing protein n=1 Tax=Treponema peruense TaxID=2787628 RepID=A0A7T3V661_9SPIR|nr:HD domain-containing protein [Treponema peruense]QQA02156.1 HD domain-containing protein [Treponema peruense]
MSLIKCVKIPEELVKIGGIFRKNGFKAYLVGGAVRDMILGKKGHDYDLATNATPKQVMGIFKKVIPTGIAHGTVTIHIFGMQIETTTFRTEADYTDGRHPDSIKFATTIEEDLSRRDFTMNAIAADLESGELTDPFDGQKDIRNKIIRTVGEPQERFAEDGLRPVRAVRFSGQLGFSIEEKTLAALSEPEVLKKTASISVERFRDEFCKMLLCERPSDSLKLLEKTGILNIFIPEFAICRNCSQKDSRGFHEFDVADHILYACDGAQKGNLEVKLAAFYHDIGKPECRTTEIVDGEERVHFHGHETKSAQKALASMTALKFPNETIKNVVHLVQEHMFYYEHSWSDAAVRRFIIRVKPENIENLFALRLADIYGMHRTPLKEGSPAWNILLEFRKRIESVLEKKSALGIKDLAVNGRDLIQEGIPSGKAMGMILNELFETVTESPAMNEKEKLLALAKNIFREKFRT